MMPSAGSILRTRPMYSATIGSERHVFTDLVRLLAKASPPRRGDVLAGIAAQSGEERVAAQYALADLPLATFLNEAIVPYETDEVTRLIIDTHDKAALAPVAHLTVGGLRDWLLSAAATAGAVAPLAPGRFPRMPPPVPEITLSQEPTGMVGQC